MSAAGKQPGQQQGFTLIELMMVVAIVAILMGIGVPAMRETVVSNRMTSQLNDLLMGINTARSEAVRNNANVLLCRSSAGTGCDNSATWADGWIVWFDENADTNVDATEIVYVGAGTEYISFKETWFNVHLTFRPDGTANTTGALRFCYGGDREGTLTIASTGRPTAKKYSISDMTGNCP